MREARYHNSLDLHLLGSGFARIFENPSGDITLLDGKGHVGVFPSDGMGGYITAEGW